MRLFAILALAVAAVSGCGRAGDDNSVHCFNQSLTLPSFTSTTCPTINPPPVAQAPAP